MKKGEHMSEETKRKIGAKLKGRVITEEMKNKISKTLKGRPLTEETKLKMSESRKGRHFTEEWKKKISESNKGKTLTEETKQKISDSRKGIPSPVKGKSLPKKSLPKKQGGRVNDSHKNSSQVQKQHKTRYVKKSTRKKISEGNIGKHTMPEDLKEVLTRMSRYGYYIQVNGQPFKSIAEVARTYNLNYQKLLKTLKEEKDLTGNPDYEERKDLEGYKDLSEFGLEYDYETSTIFKRRWGEYLEKELKERPYRQEEIIYIALKYKEKN